MEMLRCSATEIAQDTECMGIIHENFCTVKLRERHDARKIDDRSFHREDAVGYDQLARFGRCACELALERTQITMRKAMHDAEAQTRAIYNRCVIQFVGEEMVVTTNECGKHTEVRLITRAEHERRFLAHELRETLLELLVKIERPVEEPASRAAAAVTT